MNRKHDDLCVGSMGYKTPMDQQRTKVASKHEMKAVLEGQATKLVALIGSVGLSGGGNFT